MSSPGSWSGGGHPAEALSALVDGELSPAPARAVAAHVESCANCAEELQRVRAVRDAVRALPPLEPPPGLIDGLVTGLAHDPRRRRRTALVGAGAAMVAASVALFLVVPGAAIGSYRPQVGQALLRHVASVSALSAVGSMSADGGPVPLVPPQPVTPSTAPPLEMHELAAPYRAPPELAGGYRLVGAFSHPDGLQLVYERDRYGLSVFETPGELDDSALAPGGRPVEGGPDAWRWELNGIAGRVVVLDRDGVVATVVGDEPGDAVLSAARSLPEAQPLSTVQHLRRAASGVLRELSPLGLLPPPGAA